MPAVKGDGMRGLAVFISDIRNCELTAYLVMVISSSYILLFYIQDVIVAENKQSGYSTL